MSEEIIEGYSIDVGIQGENCITTAAICTSSPYVGYYLIFETIIWGWDGEKRTNMKAQISHKNEKEAKKVHGYIMENFKKGLVRN